MARTLFQTLYLHLHYLEYSLSTVRWKLVDLSKLRVRSHSDKIVLEADKYLEGGGIRQGTNRFLCGCSASVGMQQQWHRNIQQRTPGLISHMLVVMKAATEIEGFGMAGI